MPGWILALLLLQLNPAPTGAATGQVLSSPGTPAEGVRVYAIPAGDPNAAVNNPTIFESLALTDGTGHYRLDVPAGRYFIAAGSVESPTYYPDTQSLSAAKPVLISAGTIVEGINFSRFLPAGQNLAGINNRRTPNFTSVQNEITLGQQQAAEFERGVTLFDDPATNDYVNRVTQNIVKNSDSRFSVVIKVVKSDIPTPTVLAGGFIYLTTGMIRSTDNEAELALVIAQMVGHVAARHVTANAAKAQILQIALQPAITKSGVSPEIANREFQQFLLPATMARFSRSDVNEADFLGLQYLYKSGYDPQAAVTFLKKLETQESASPGRTPDALADSPPAADRLHLILPNVRGVLPTRATNIQNSDEFVVIKTRVSN